MDFLSDSNTASALDVIFFIREIVEVGQHTAGAHILYGQLGDGRVVWAYSGLLTYLGAQAVTAAWERECAFGGAVLHSCFPTQAACPSGPAQSPAWLGGLASPAPASHRSRRGHYGYLLFLALQTNPKLHDTIIERLMDTFPAIRASRVAACALWIISEYCVTKEEIAAALEVGRDPGWAVKVGVHGGEGREGQ